MFTSKKYISSILTITPHHRYKITNNEYDGQSNFKSYENVDDEIRLSGLQIEDGTVYNW